MDGSWSERVRLDGNRIGSREPMPTPPVQLTTLTVSTDSCGRTE